MGFTTAPRILELHSGFSAEISDSDSVDDAEIRRIWELARKEIGELCRELHANYHSEQHGVEPLAAENVWRTIVDPQLAITGADSLELSVTFDWQHPNDDLVTTIFVENGATTGCAIDG